MRFSSLRMQIEGCNCREYPDLKGGNLLCPLPCSTAGRVVYGHPICTVKIPHITVIICHNCRHFRVPVFIAIINSIGWIVNICQEARVSLVPPHHSSQVILGQLLTEISGLGDCELEHRRESGRRSSSSSVSADT